MCTHIHTHTPAILYGIFRTCWFYFTRHQLFHDGVVSYRCGILYDILGLTSVLSAQEATTHSLLMAETSWPFSLSSPSLEFLY